jgi:hypothetical protein
MNSPLELARNTALLVFPDASDVKFGSVNKTGDEQFVASRQGKIGQLIITIQTSHNKAAVEWKGYLNKTASYFRIFRIENFPLDN